MFPFGRVLVRTPAALPWPGPPADLHRAPALPWPGPPCRPSYIKLVFGSPEHDVFVYCVPRANLAASRYLSDMLEDVDEQDRYAELPIPEVGDRKVAASIVAFLADSTLPNFLDSSNRFVYDVAAAADYLDIPILLDTSTKEIVRRWNTSSSVEDIRALWGFEDDLSHAEKQAIENETFLLFGQTRQRSNNNANNTYVSSPRRLWRWSFHILYAILLQFPPSRIACIRAVSFVLWNVSKQLPPCHFADTIVTPNINWMDTSLGFAERYCTLRVTNSDQAELVQQLNVQHVVYSLFLLQEDPAVLFPFEHLFARLSNLKRLIFQSRIKVDPYFPSGLPIVTLGDLHDLEYLEIYGRNEMNINDTQVLATLPNLQTLIISPLTFTLDSKNAKALSILQNLQHLEINGFNNFGNEGARALACLQNLRRLVFHQGSAFESESAIALSVLQNLQYLKIGPNKIGPEGAAALSNLENLQHLEIGNHNKIGWEGVVALSKLQNLTYLNIGSYNDLNDIHAIALSDFQNLQHLVIGEHNDLGDEGSGALSNLNHLQRLSIGGRNKIGSKGVENLLRLTQLQDLRIGDNNDIGLAGAEALSNMQPLEHLEIGRGNNIGEEGAVALSTLQNLRHLVIGSKEYGASNNIGAAGASALSNLRNLQHLEIYMDTIGAEGATALSRLQTLTHLVVGSFNNIGAEGAVALSRLQNLQYLVIGSNNNIKKEGAVALSRLQTLTYLLIDSDNHIGTEGAIALSNLQNLTFLMINFSENIDTKGITALSRLQNLRYLTIRNNSRRDREQIREVLRTSLPNTKISYM